MLNLEVLTCSEAKLPVFIVESKVSCTVNRLQISVIQRVLNKCLLCLFRISIIAKCKRTTCHTNLTVYPLFCNQMIFFIQKEDFFVRKGFPHWKHISRFKVSVNNIICTITGNLCRTINIYKHSIWKIFSPDIKMLNRHNLSREQNLFNLVWHLIGKTIQGTDNAHSRHSPYDRGNLSLNQKIKKILRNRKILFGNDLHSGPGFQA